jgi:hypothetical protein
MAEETQIKFPATRIVHWPTGPVAACDEHSLQLLGLSRFLGAHVGVSNAPDGAECGNCKNEARNG